MDSNPSAAPNSLFELGQDCVVAILRHCTMPMILRFSESNKAAHGLAGDNQIWRPLYEARRWTGVVAERVQSKEDDDWRIAYRKAARAESPLVLQMTEFRALIGFAKDGEPTVVGPPLVRLHDSAEAVNMAVGPIIDAALCAIGLRAYDRAAKPLLGADVVLLVGASDGSDEMEPLLRHLFLRGAKRVRLADATLAALRHAGGLRTGTVVTFDLDSVSAACVVDGVRLAPRRRIMGRCGLRTAVQYLARQTPPPPPPPPPPPAAPNAAAASSGGGCALASASPASMVAAMVAGGVAASPVPTVPSGAQLTLAAISAMSGGDSYLGRWMPTAANAPQLPDAQPAVSASHPSVPPPAQPRPTPAQATPAATAAATSTLPSASSLEPVDPVLVERLRETTGATAPHCREALRRHGGNADAAALWLLTSDSNGPSDAPDGNSLPSSMSQSAAVTTATAAAGSAAGALPTTPTTLDATLRSGESRIISPGSSSGSCAVSGFQSVSNGGPRLSEAEAQVGADLSFLLQRHCYVRAVSVERRPVSGEEATMAGCVVQAPSGRKWRLEEVRFMAFEQIFRGVPLSPGVPVESARVAGTAGAVGAVGAAAPSASGGDGSVACACNGGVAGSGLAAALALSSGGNSNGGNSNTSSSSSIVPAYARSAIFPSAACASAAAGIGSVRCDGAIDVLKATIDACGTREQMVSLYGAVLLTGAGGAVPGMRQRFESELRQIRNDPQMPRTLRPRLVEHANSLTGGEDMVKNMQGPAERGRGGRRGGGRDGGGGGGEGGGVEGGDGADGKDSTSHADCVQAAIRNAAWALTEAEAAAWLGTAEEACVHARISRGGVYSSSAPGWTYADQFSKESRFATRAALKAAGCPMERWTDTSDRHGVRLRR